MRRSLTFCALLFLCAAPLAAGEPLAWPRFRGPDGSGVAEGQKPPLEIGPAKNVKWKVAVPPGLSSPIVAGDKLVLTAFDGGALVTIAYNRADGKEAWRAVAPAEKIEPYHKTEGSPAASTPATDGERIVSYFGSCGLFCYDLAGKELWKFELPPASTVGDFGTGVSPIIAEGTVVLVREETKDPKIIVVEAATGAPRWEKPRQSTSGFATPVYWPAGGGQIAVAGFGRMIGYDLRTGDETWSVAGMPSSCCPSPVVAGNMLYYAGWSPGDADDPDFKMPTFDETLRQGDADGDGKISFAESSKTWLNGFFENNDQNKDGFFTRDEADALMKFLSASKNSAFALKAGGTGDVTKSHIAWKKTRGLPYVPSAIFHRGQFVLVKDGGIVTAYDGRNGTIVHQGRSIASGRYYASPVAAGEAIYFASLENGTVTVLKAGARKAQVLARNPPLDERVSATPAIAENTLYIRTAGHLYAFAER